MGNVLACYQTPCISLDLLGFSNKRLLEHHRPILHVCKSSLKSVKVFKVSYILKDITSLVSCT